jgi:hypothetical protein
MPRRAGELNAALAESIDVTAQQRCGVTAPAKAVALP